VQKSSGKLYWYGMGADALDETDTAGNTNNSTFNEYVFFGGKRKARRDFSNTVFYYFADHLGTSRAIVQAGQTAACYEADFYPFGGERAPLVNSCPQNYKFAGMEYDSESNLNYTEFRQYASSQGRWLSPDPFSGSLKLSNPQSLNRYVYVLNNPTMLHDPKGLDCIYDAAAAKDANLPGPEIKTGDCYSDSDGGVFVDGTVYNAYLDTDTGIATFQYENYDTGKSGSQEISDGEWLGEGGSLLGYDCDGIDTCTSKAPSREPSTRLTRGQQQCVLTVMAGNDPAMTSSQPILNFQGLFSAYSYFPGNDNFDKAWDETGKALLLKGRSVVGGRIIGKILSAVGQSKAGAAAGKGANIFGKTVGVVASVATVVATISEAQAREACGAPVLPTLQVVH
jgi:RHS repeat-associated protein